MLKDVLKAFHLIEEQHDIHKIGDGLINSTWKITNLNKEPVFILQQVNKQVFLAPNDIADNINKISNYLLKHQPDYLFVSPLPAATGAYTFQSSEEEYYRLFPYVKGAVTINAIQTPAQAFEAALQFARFTKLLINFDESQLYYTLPGFHDLATRFTDFQYAVKSADKNRLIKATQIIEKAREHQQIAKTHLDIIKNSLIPLRVIHHDTKISNVLFDQQNKGLCVIDLDTVMPGYYISDIGDMMRTYLSPVTEEEQDLTKIEIREDVFAAIAEGYLSEMGAYLTDIEKSLFVYAGKFMIYMQAIRFITDYLKNDTYYSTTYPDHNLIRAQNQFVLLEKYIEAEDRFTQIINHYSTETAI